MPCYSPLKGWQRLGKTATGGRQITFNKRESNTIPMTVPCGQCIGCRLKYSRDWAIRCMHESQMHSENCFITLTYNPENLPYDGSLVLEHFQKFMKRLRKNLWKNHKKKISFYHCGEYGTKLSRPHYHACIFGHDFEDKKIYKTLNGNPLYISETLEKIWGKGFATVGALTYESAAYVARYITKKISGTNATEHYISSDPYTGEIYNLQPEYVTMSRRPPIGKDWFEKYGKDVYPSDEVIIKGKPVPPPRFYDQQLRLAEPGLYEIIKDERITEAKKRKHDNTTERLLTKEKVKLSQFSQLKRSYEEQDNA